MHAGPRLYGCAGRRQRHRELRTIGVLMRWVAEALFAAETTRARTAKVAALAAALVETARRDPARLPFVARFLTGKLVPPAWPFSSELGAGGALVFEAACAVSEVSPSELG